MKTVRMGVIGAGWWATFAHIPAINAHPQAELVAVQSRERAKAEKIARDFGAQHACTGVEELISIPGLDAVVVASTPNVHFAQAKAALERGRHVLLEKPMTFTVGEARELVELAAKRKLQLAISCPWHFTRHGIEARRLVHSGALGEVKMISVLMTNPIDQLLRGINTSPTHGMEDVYVEPRPGSYNDPAIAGGGQIYCQVSHAAAYLTFLTGLRPAEVFARFDRDGSPNDIYNALTLTLENGALVSLASTAATPLAERNYEVRVFGSRAILQLELWRGTMTLIDFAGQRTEFEPLAESEIYPSQSPALNFIDAILGKAANGSPGSLGLSSMEIIEAACESAQTGRNEKIRAVPAAAGDGFGEISGPQGCGSNFPSMSSPVRLAGIAWDHSRALPPLVATAQRYEETHPGVRIHWQKRTLDEFGHAPVDVLAQQFDLIVIDHPWAGFCFEKNLVHDLKPLLSAAALAELKKNSIGETFNSYLYRGKLLALPIDAAAPAPSWRPDLLERADVQPPETWAEAVALTQRKLAVIPAFNADLFLHFVMLIQGLGAEPFADCETIAPREILRQAVEMLRELTAPMPREIFTMNPIQVAGRMTTTDDFAWNAFAYTYNNYARPGFAPKPLRFGNLLSLKPGGPRLRSVLGGTGMAISANCQDAAAALDYALFTASGRMQKTIYLHAGGQPSHRSAWDDPLADQLCGGFFSGTRRTQEEAFVRPRYRGYVALQTDGGNALQEHLRDGRSLDATLDKLDALHRESRARDGRDFQTNSPHETEIVLH